MSQACTSSRLVGSDSSSKTVVCTGLKPLRQLTRSTGTAVSPAGSGSSATWPSVISSSRGKGKYEASRTTGSTHASDSNHIGAG